MSNDDLCPECGEKTEREEIDVGPGNVHLPRSCPGCHWSEDDAVLKTVVPRFGQPAPIANGNPPLWDMVINDFKNKFAPNEIELYDQYLKDIEKIIADMRARDDFGRAKYGMPLQANNGHNPLKDAYEELLDAAVYMKQAIAENGLTPDQINHIREKYFDILRMIVVLKGYLPDWKVNE